MVRQRGVPDTPRRSREPTMRSRVSFALLLLVAARVSAAPIDFNRDVAPVLAKRCAGCHNNSEARGDLKIITREGLLRGGSGGPAVVPGKPEQSAVLRRVLDGEMPPKERGVVQKLPEGEVKLLREWIAAGAPWPKDRVLNPYELTTEQRGGLDWWSLRPVRRPPVPGVTGGPGDHPIGG